MSSRAKSYGASPWPWLIEHNCSNSNNIGSRPVGLSFFHVNTEATGKQRWARMGEGWELSKELVMLLTWV